MKTSYCKKNKIITIKINEEELADIEYELNELDEREMNFVWDIVNSCQGRLRETAYQESQES